MKPMPITTTPTNSSPCAVNSMIRMGGLLSIEPYPNNWPYREKILRACRWLIALAVELLLDFFRNAGAMNRINFGMHRTPPDHATRDVQRNCAPFADQIVL